MRRREFVRLLGGSAAFWPLAARAQQAKPIIGYISGRSAESDAPMLVAVRHGLDEIGYLEGRNVTIEYRFADGQNDRSHTLLAELIRLKVNVIIAAGLLFSSTRIVAAFKASPIPVVFNSGTDPVRTGLITSMNRPGGNVTGVFSVVQELTIKHVGLLHDLAPDAQSIALLANPVSPATEQQHVDAAEATAKLKVQLRTFDASTDSELDTAFGMMDREPPDAMMIESSPFFVTRAKRITGLVTHRRIPAIYARREFAAAGGLMSYGYDVGESYRQMGNYAGRVLKGASPADLPVIRPTKYDLIINLKAAKELGIQVPPLLLARADEVIE